MNGINKILWILLILSHSVPFVLGKSVLKTELILRRTTPYFL